MWLRDFLAPDLEYDDLQTRILTFGYDSTLVGSTSDSSIHEYSRKLLEALRASREHTKVRELGRTQVHVVMRSSQEEYRPIIFIAHSLGGLILKHVSGMHKDLATRVLEY